MKNAIVIIPSFNSSPWIVDLIKKVLAREEALQAIVIDDNSPDGTSKIIEKNFGGNRRVRLIKRREKGGRGSAVIAGFKEALIDKRAKYLIEMDSDLAHDPSDIPRLARACEKYDVVIGSRYISGGLTLHYGNVRKIFSRLSNIFANAILSVNIADYTSGFRCYRREVLEAIDLDSIETVGFITLSELIYKINRKGFRIGEVPIKVVYHPRYKSNLNLKEIVNAFISVLKIRFKG